MLSFISLNLLGALPWDLIYHLTREQGVSTHLQCKGEWHQESNWCAWSQGCLVHRAWGPEWENTQGLITGAPEVDHWPGFPPVAAQLHEIPFYALP